MAAARSFRTTHSLNAEISRLSRSPSPHKTLAILRSMLTHGPPIDHYTLPPILRSLPLLSSPLHALSFKLSLLSPPLVSSLLLSSPSPSHSLSLFSHIPPPLRDTVLITSLLSSLSRLSSPLLSLSLFSSLFLPLNLPLDEPLLLTLLSSCSLLPSLPVAHAIHARSLRAIPSLTLNLHNSLIDTYVKCGAFTYADTVFATMPTRDVFSWSALMRPDNALHLFDRMIHERKVKPNGVTFLAVLAACAHLGMVERAWRVLEMMRGYGVGIELKHYACMVDVLGRVGEVREAERLVEEMPVEADEAVLGALLSGCRVHGEVEVGERVARRLMRMCPGKSGYYASLANLYSDAGRFEEAERVRGLMKQMNVGKLVGLASIELDGSSSRTHNS